MFHGHLDYFEKPPLGGGPNTKPLGDYSTTVGLLYVIINDRGEPTVSYK
jgi:hypothetical protein